MMNLLGETVLKKGEIKADLEHLRKLFIMPDSPDKFMEFGFELLDLIHSFFKDKGGIHSEISLPELSKIFSNIDIPTTPNLLKDILSEIKTKIISHSVKVGNPYYIGHMTSAIPYFMILIEMIIAALNQNQVKIETAKASTFVERELIAWIHRIIFDCSPLYYKTHIQNHNVALGNVTLDGTIANLTAMLIARNKIFAPDGRFPGVRKAGINEAFRYYKCKKAVIICSKRGHYSIDKIARIIGIGENNVIKVPVDRYNKIDISKLKQISNQIKEANRNEKEKIKIISLIGIAGTTETGNIDNLVELRKLADEHKSYFHVDAAWGGAVLLVDKYRHLLKGIESADSVTFDAHKLLYSPLSMGLVLFNDETALNYLKHTSEYIIRADSVDQGRFTVEGSRPFSCLKPWATLKIFGSNGIKLLFELAFDLTKELISLIKNHSNFEPMNYPELFITNYRFVPEAVQQELNYLMNLVENEDSNNKNEILEKIKNINTVLNDLNIELHRIIRQEDNSFVSRTMLESTRYSPQKIVVLRAVTINPLTTPEIIKEIIDEQNRLGTNIYYSKFINRFDELLIA
ncbi:MAG: pyridoxal-dependent decarboxylase [Spirochaetota bacterium]|nr:pyridoxal-dependent decarboxylase [Spirochaetota bacterium]